MPALNPERQAANEEFNNVIGTNIRVRRQRMRMTLAELAELVDMDISVLSRIEAGERAIRLRDAQSIALVFGIKLETLCRKQHGVLYN